MNELYKRVTNDEEGFYYYFNYADFILIFSRILKVYLEFDIKLEFTDCNSIFLLSIYGNDDQIKIWKACSLKKAENKINFL